jgi:hypothetical protein
MSDWQVLRLLHPPELLIEQQAFPKTLEAGAIHFVDNHALAKRFQREDRERQAGQAKSNWRNPTQAKDLRLILASQPASRASNSRKMVRNQSLLSAQPAGRMSS